MRLNFFICDLGETALPWGCWDEDFGRAMDGRRSVNVPVAVMIAHHSLPP